MPIGISDNRAMHMLGVARRCESITRQLGWSESSAAHATVGSDVIMSADMDKQYADAIKWHGTPLTQVPMHFVTDELLVLDLADMTTGPCGETMTMDERLADIGVRYGIESRQYDDAHALTQELSGWHSGVDGLNHHL